MLRHRRSSSRQRQTRVARKRSSLPTSLGPSSSRGSTRRRTPPGLSRSSSRRTTAPATWCNNSPTRSQGTGNGRTWRASATPPRPTKTPIITSLATMISAWRYRAAQARSHTITQHSSWSRSPGRSASSRARKRSGTRVFRSRQWPRPIGTTPTEAPYRIAKSVQIS